MEFSALLFGLALLVFEIWLYFWVCSQFYQIGENMGLDYNWISYIPGFQMVQVMRLAGWGWGAGWISFLIVVGINILLGIKTIQLSEGTASILLGVAIAIGILYIIAFCAISAKLKQGWAMGLIMIIPLFNLIALSNFTAASKHYAIANGIKTLQDFEKKKEPSNPQDEEGIENLENIEELQKDLGTDEIQKDQEVK